MCCDFSIFSLTPLEFPLPSPRSLFPPTLLRIGKSTLVLPIAFPALVSMGSANLLELANITRDEMIKLTSLLLPCVSWGWCRAGRDHRRSSELGLLLQPKLKLLLDIPPACLNVL